LQIGNEAMENAIQLRHQHLVNLMLENVIIPRHPVGHHDERCSLLDEIPRHERVQAEGTGTIASAIVGLQLVDVEEVRACHQAVDTLEGSIQRGGGTAPLLILITLGKEATQGLAGGAIITESVGGSPKLGVASSQADRAVLGSEPAVEV